MQERAANKSANGELSDAELAGVTGGTENPLNVGAVKSFISRLLGTPKTSTPETPTPVTDPSKTFQAQKPK